MESESATYKIEPGTYHIQNVATKKYVTNEGAKEGQPVQSSNSQIAVSSLSFLRTYSWIRLT